MSKLYENIRKLRTIKGLSQQNMADELGISQKHFSRIERGEIDMRYSMLCKISGLLDADVRQLVAYTDDVFTGKQTTLKNTMPVNPESSVFYERIIKEKDNTITLLQNLVQAKLNITLH